MKFIIALNLLLVLPLMLLGAPSGTFDLRINDVSGLDEPWPLIGGLPFPEGALHDADQIRVVDADGVETPAQIDVVARWRDGSIRWAQAGLTASLRGDYRVEFGPGVSRRAPATPLRIDSDAAGGLSVDTGAAVYEFLPDRLLPETARMGETVFLSNAGDGAYLIDNQGRLARVAGEAAEIETRILKQGPVRTVIRREGWYVTADGAQVARAKAWFYLSAGSPHLRITHSLVLTEDTNDLWIRDYGLAFNTTDSPEEAVFALGEATPEDRFRGRLPEEQRRSMAEMFSTGLVEREQRLFTSAPDGDEVYMLQENYPHVLERDFRAVVARAAPRLADVATADLGNLWMHPWLVETEVAGDWGEARFGDHALMVVMPQLAQRFPKEIAIGPKGARVAFWSGRSGRELDFRAVTLVNETWKQWADNAIHPFGLSGRGPAIGTKVAQQPSNAQGAARTHDVWLLPRTDTLGEPQLKARGLAAAHPPLLDTDPEWLGASEAVGWPFHPKDTEYFPVAEAALSDYWENTLAGGHGNADLRRSGFVMWGKNVTIGSGVRLFRLSRGAGHYGLDRSAWLLYMRSGERRYYDYARHFTRFAGDLKITHWNAGRKFRGGFSGGTGGSAGDPPPHVHMPFYWGNHSTLHGPSWTLGWQLDYYLTGDEYPNELLRMMADAYREQADPDRPLTGYIHNHLSNLSILYQHTQDETIRKLAHQAAHVLMDLDNPIGLNDRLRYGVYYKTSTEWLFPLYVYYQATGDEAAREVILRALDDKFRFFYTSNQTVRLFLFAEAYRWTGNRAYLGLTKLMVESPFFSLMGHNVFLGAPSALYAIANAAQPIAPFPVLAVTREANSVVSSDFTGVIMDHVFIDGDALPPLRVRKPAGAPVNLSLFVKMPAERDENMEPDAVVTPYGPDGEGAAIGNVQIVKTQRFVTRNEGRRTPQRWHVALTLPAELAAGDYRLRFPNATTLVVLESDALEIKLESHHR